MSVRPAFARRNIVKSVQLLLVLGLIIFFCYSLIRLMMDRSNYNQGHQAYLQADCLSAIQFFDNVITRWRFADIGQYSLFAQQEEAECQSYQAAVNLETNGDAGAALVFYINFIIDKGGSPVAQAARNRITSLFQLDKILNLANETSCTKIDTLINLNLVPDPTLNLPLFYYACGQVYDRANQPEYSFAIYQWILTAYPDHPVSLIAESSLLNNPIACREIEKLRRGALNNRPNFLPTLYYKCGQKLEAENNLSGAIEMYQNFMNYYSDNPAANDVKVALVRALVAQAKTSGAGVIPQPQTSGIASSGTTELVIQNDSPYRVRLIFSGQDSQIENLEPCSICTTFASAPASCPELGPIGRYTLSPGSYEVLFESISESKVTPLTNTWTLQDGNQYSYCIFVITK